MERKLRNGFLGALALGLGVAACAGETKGDGTDQTGAAGSAGISTGAAGTSAPGPATGTGTGTGTGTSTGTGTGAAGVTGSTTGAAGSTIPIMTGPMPCTVAATDALIDDFETGLNGALHTCVHGYWYTYNDKSAGMQTPAMNMFKPEAVTDLGTSKYAAHSTAMGFSGDAMGNAYAAFGLDFAAEGTAKAVIDASAFKGITFQAKGTGTLRVELHTKTSDPAFGCAAMCYDVPYKTITLTAAWQKFTLPWSDFVQDKFGTPETTNGKNLGSIHFASKAAKMAIGAYDMWLDDLQFSP